MRLKSAFRRSRTTFCLGLASALAFALPNTSALSQSLSLDADASAATFSSSLTSTDPLPEAPAPHSGSFANTRALPAGDREPRPFHSLAVGLILGTGGIGLELATPLNTKFNLRGSASFFGYHTSFVEQTIPIDGTLHLSNVNAVVDYFPRARSFHISPGVTFYEDSHFNANIFVPGGQVVVFNDQNYTSDPNDPIRGTANIQFGHQVAPRLTIGYGNVIRHNTAGFTFPVEVGFEYIHTPTAVFNLTGSSCDNAGNCGPINSDPETQQNIQEQQNEINDDIRPFRFFPIISVGISYKFGH